jgi:hypothetical protein
VLDGHLGQNVSGTVDGATLAQAMREDELDCGDQAGGSVGDDQQRCSQPSATMTSKKAFQASVAPRRPSRGRSVSSVVTPHAVSTGSARAPSCIRKWLPSKNRY